MLLCRRLFSITGQAHRIHHRTFFSQRVLKQAEVTTPGDCGVPPFQPLDDANEDTPNTHPAGTLEPQKISDSASSTVAAYVYDKKRQNDPEVALDLISNPYVQKLRKAKQNNDYHFIRTLIVKIIRADEEDNTTRANKLHFALLSVSLDKLPPNMVVSMLRTVTTFLGGQEYHSRAVIDRIIPLIFNSSPNEAQKLVDLIFPSLLFNLKNTKVQRILTGTPSPFVLASFTLLRWLLPRSQERSVELYKILVDTGHVPSSALQDENVKSGTLTTLIYASSIKTCGQRGWTELAAEFLNDYVETGENSRTIGTDLALELVGYLLDSPSENDLHQCCNLIERLHTFQPVPDEIIRDFYATATQFNFSRPAERLYLFTRNMRVDKFKPHNYPLPQGRSLVWLAEDLASDDSTRSYFESLVEEAHEQHQDALIPASHQPQYLKLVVKEGFGLISRSLWEKWAQGISGEVIRGSPEILVRIIRLQRSLTRKQEDRLICLEKCVFPDSAEIKKSRRKLDGISSFANKVLRAFIIRHEPLHDADHIVLTSLARAHIVLGNISDGFHCFRLLLRRFEKPDTIDINVGLTALAEYEPRAAAAFVTSMIHYHVIPDEHTFSTVIHHAMIKDDLDLCTKLAVQMKETLLPDSNFRPFYSMASASVVERSGDTPQRQVMRLKTVLEVLRIMDYPANRFSMYPEIGQSLIRASLPHYPEVAFEFWELVCKGMSRSDLEYCNQVKLIRKALRDAWNRGNIEGIKMREMLSKLLRN